MNKRLRKKYGLGSTTMCCRVISVDRENRSVCLSEPYRLKVNRMRISDFRPKRPKWMRRAGLRFGETV